MRRLTVLCLICLAAVAGAIDVPSAFAGDGPARGEAVGQLTAEELALLKTKLPNWDDLDPHKQDRIARHVLRLRNMAPKDRERFQHRMARMRDAARTHVSPGRRGHHPSVYRAALGQAMQAMLEADWPEGVALAEQRKWSRARLVGAFLRTRLMRRIGEFELDRALGEDFDLATAFPDLPESRREKLASLIERARTGDKRARHALGRTMFHLRAGELRSAAAKGQDAVVAHVRATWQAPYAEALAEVRNDVEGFVKRAEARRGARGPVRRREWASLALKLDDMVTRAASSDAAFANDAHALMRRVLIDKLGVTQEQIDALPPRTDVARRRAFWKLLPGARGPGFGGRMRGDHPRKDRRRGGRGSDEK